MRRRNTLLRLAFFAVVLAGLIVLGVMLWRSPGGELSTYDGAPAWTPDSRTLLFAAERGSQSDVFAMALDGTNRRPLTDAPGEDGAPAVSPDGRTIAFESNRDGNFDIYLMDIDGRNVRRLTNDAATDRAPSWSPDGTRLAFLSDRDRRPDFDIYLTNADGSALQRLTTTGANWAPQFSPDGRLLAYQGDRDVRVLDFDDGSIRRLTFEPQNGMSPTWSPDGRRLAFATTRSARLEIFTMAADGSNQQMLVSMPGASVMDPRWSPDGTRIAFVHVPTVEGETGNSPQPYAIYVMEVEGRRLRRVSR